MENRRIKMELQEMQTCDLTSFRELRVHESNMFVWEALLVPDNPPYNAGAFKIEITFPIEYPFKPPKITFKTKIYHPNIDDKGLVCLPIITHENWRPATRTIEVIQALVALINDPQPDSAVRADIAQEFLKDRQKFNKNADAFTKKYGEKRPEEII